MDSPAENPSFGSNGRYLWGMNEKRTPSPDPLIELLIRQIQATGTRAETALNFNTVYGCIAT